MNDADPIESIHGWTDRRTSTGYESAGALSQKYNRDNWRGHPALQRDAVEESIGKLGWVDAVKVNRRTDTLIDGHLRVELALIRHGEDHQVPVDYYDLTEEEEALALLTLDSTTEQAEVIPDKFAALMEKTRSLRINSDKLNEVMAKTRERAGVPEPDEPLQDAPEPKPDKAAELREKWQTALGQVWQLGGHRVVCGDCTDAAVVEAVAFGEKFDMVFTDPPYGVSYADKNEYLNAVAKGNSIQTPIENDHLSVDEASALWLAAFSNLFEATKDGGSYYITAPQGGDLMMMMMMMIKEAGWLLKPQIVWVKNNHVLGRSDYQLKHEPILYGWKPGAGHYFIDSRSEFSVWEFPKPQNSDLHPTTKPVELVAKAIHNSSRRGEIVADFFLGSGTTLIAAEQLGRKCRGIEISPEYVAVTLERWHKMTGLEPVLVEG